MKADPAAACHVFSGGGRLRPTTDRIVPKPEHAAELKKRTLPICNARPAWLDNARKGLDAAIAAACGWADYPPDMPGEENLRRLLAPNTAGSPAPA